MRLDGCGHWTFDQDALVEAVASEVCRAYRPVREDCVRSWKTCMMDSMYEVPSDKTITSVHVTKEMVDENLLLEDKSGSITAIGEEQEKSA